MADLPRDPPRPYDHHDVCRGCLSKIHVYTERSHRYCGACRAAFWVRTGQLPPEPGLARPHLRDIASRVRKAHRHRGRDHRSPANGG